MRRIGLLGGTFNPVHVGHVRLGLEMLEALGLDAVEYLPAARPPHKTGEGMLPFFLRLELLEAALDDLPGLVANPVEAERSGPSYTWDTLEHLNRTRPGVAWYFIMGAGDLLCLHLWKRGLELGGQANLAVSSRDSLGAREVGEYIEKTPEMGLVAQGRGRWRFSGGNELVLVEVPRLDISASFIRERFARGACLRYLLPATVERRLEASRSEVLLAWKQPARNLTQHDQPS
ncbi:nicotinate (nicotinamide) nucleotide adenylyltransferase [Fundidesulfovibrio butyratiphilus]